MTNPDQMTREELLTARARVQDQLRILQSPVTRLPFVGRTTTNSDDLVGELTQILDQIEFELGKTHA